MISSALASGGNLEDQAGGRHVHAAAGSRISAALAVGFVLGPRLLSPIRMLAIEIGLEQRHGARIVPLAIDQEGKQVGEAEAGERTAGEAAP